MRNIAWTFAACLLCICSLTITNLRAQSNNASITGEISDPKGAVIQGAQVTLTSKDTKQTSNYVSDGPRRAFLCELAIPFARTCI